MTFSGATTLNGSFLRSDGAYALTFGGAVTVAETTAIPADNDMHATFNGAVTVNAGKTLTMPAGRVTIGENAAFTLGLGATLVDGTESITAYKVGPAEAGYTVREIQDGVWRAVEEATWTGAAENDNKWTTAGNWSTGEVPTETTFVTIPDGAVISLTTHDGTEKCAGIAVAGDAEIRYDGTGWVELYMYGGISGEHTLTLHHVCLNNKSGIRQEIASPFVIDTKLDNEGNDGDCAMIGGWDISGDLTVKGVIKAQAQALTVTGNATIEEGATLWSNQRIEFSGSTTFNGTFLRKENNGLDFGNITVAGTTTMPNDANVTFNGTVTIAADQTLTIPESATIGDGATFVLNGFGATLVDNGGLVAEEKVTTPITKGAKIAITTEGSKKTYKLSPVGMMLILR